MASLNIGITGGTGNISAYITRRLVAVGHEVVLFNRSGRAPEGATAVRVDRGERDAFIEAVRGARLQVGIDMLCFNAEDARTSLEAFKSIISCIATTPRGDSIRSRWRPTHPRSTSSSTCRSNVTDVCSPETRCADRGAPHATPCHFSQVRLSDGQIFVSG